MRKRWQDELGEKVSSWVEGELLKVDPQIVPALFPLLSVRHGWVDVAVQLKFHSSEPSTCNEDTTSDT